MPKRSTKTPGASTVRIIGGEWRGRKLVFPDLAGLRPTPDRLRETLFNWLAPKLTNSKVLDLYCGSGALGLEACSRGAAELLLVDKAAAVERSMRENLTSLKAGANIHFIRANVSNWLESWPDSKKFSNHRFDIIFYDPPYAEQNWFSGLETIATQNMLQMDGLLYTERPREAQQDLPPGWEVWREKTTGNNRYLLLGRP